LLQDASSAKKFSEQAAEVYENATGGVLGKNMLLYFAHADFEETRMKYERVHQIYQRILEIEDLDPTLVRKYENSDKYFPRDILSVFLLLSNISLLSYNSTQLKKQLQLQISNMRLRASYNIIRSQSSHNDLFLWNRVNF